MLDLRRHLIPIGEDLALELDEEVRKLCPFPIGPDTQVSVTVENGRILVQPIPHVEAPY